MHKIVTEITTKVCSQGSVCYFSKVIIPKMTMADVNMRTQSYLKAHHLLFCLVRAIVVNLVAHTLPAGPGQPLNPLPHQDLGAFDPTQYGRGPDLPLPHHATTWHALTLSPYLQRRAQVGLK